MPYTLTTLPPLPFDTVIDVRAPSEFAEDHIPGAINLPVLSDAERATVGTIYVRQDRFLARKTGAALVARNTAAHIEGPLADKDGGWRPLVYCWRGGQRSGSFASILSQIGWRVDLIEGGYRSYRRLVSALLYDTPLTHRLVLVDGGTGTGKTQLLHRMAAQGAQMVDLEGLAGHRGSNFGGWSEDQPAQKMFESRLAQTLAGLDPSRPVFVEAESSSIGRIKLPPALWRAMRLAPVVRLAVPLSARARFLTTTYPDLTADAALLARRIDSLRPYHSGDRIAAWHDLARGGRFETLAEGLIEAHYDPRYRRPGGSERVELGTVALSDLSEAELDRAAERVMGLAGAAGAEASEG